MEGLYHLFSNGSESVDLFSSEKELDDALNRLAVVSAHSGVTILGCGIQDTHVHALVRGVLEAVLKFKTEYQKRTRDTLTRTRNDARLNDFKMDMLAVETEEYARRVAAYVICQATKDGKHIMHYDYRWSTAALYFRTVKNDLLWRQTESGKPKQVTMMADISMNTQKQLFHVGERLPDNWEVCDGLILPSSYVDVEGFEQLFKTHNCFRTFCGSSSVKDNEILDSIANTLGVSIEENEARIMACDLSKKLFFTSDIRTLDVNERIRVGRELRQKYRMGIPQISRRIHLPEAEVRKYIK